MKIHPSAVVSPHAQIDADVTIGPFCTIDDGVRIEAGCRLESRVVVRKDTHLGPGNHVFEGAVLGGLPQHQRMPEQVGSVVIGSGNVIRENSTVHRAMKVGCVTRIGSNNLLMVNAHVAHDCVIGSNIVLANNAMLAGHVSVEDRAFVSGAVGIHQFCRVGRLAMVGGHARVVQDVPPFVTIDGISGDVVGLNLVGLRRNGYTQDQVAELKAAYRIIYRSGLKWSEVLERLKVDFAAGPAAEFFSFLSGGTRGFVQERRTPRAATIKLPTPVEATAVELRSKAG